MPGIDRETLIKRRGKAKERGLTCTLDEIEIALRLSRGHVAKAAELLKVEPPVLRRKVKFTPRLAKVQEDIMADEVDNAKTSLFELIDQRNPQATTFLLRTQGKDQGFTEKNTLEHEVGESVRSAAALIGSMRKGAKQIEDDDDTIDVVPTLIEQNQDAT